MQVSHISISNILGLQELDIEPGQITLIEGANGQGKTSILESIKAALKTGHDATLLRTGAEQGEIVLVLDNGTSITKKVTEKSSTTEIRDANGKKVARPAEALQKLVDMMSINPVDFLLAPPKDRVRVLLESMPLKADVEKLQQITGIPVTFDAGKVHALDAITVVHKNVYDERTGTNRAVKEKDNTINQLRHSLPDLPEGIETGDETELSARKDALVKSKGETFEAINKRLAEMDAKDNAELATLREETQRQIDEIKAAAQVKADEIKARIADQNTRATNKKAELEKKLAEDLAPIEAQLLAIRNNRDIAAKRAQAMDTIAKMEEELTTLQDAAAKQTKALADLEDYKLKLISELPIPGLVVQDGEIYRNGVHFDRLNTAQQVMIAVEIAKLRAGELGIVCVDRMEMLDKNTFEMFEESARESGLQMFVTRVTDEELQINSI